MHVLQLIIYLKNFIFTYFVPGACILYCGKFHYFLPVPGFYYWEDEQLVWIREIQALTLVSLRPPYYNNINNWNQKYKRKDRRPKLLERKIKEKLTISWRDAYPISKSRVGLCSVGHNFGYRFTHSLHQQSPDFH